MSIPYGAIVTSAVSLVQSIKNPSASNVVGATTQFTSLGNNQPVTNTANAGATLGATFTSLGQGRPLDARNGVNQAVRLASGFMDPKTAAIASSVLSGANMLFGGGGGLSLLGFGGNKPYALHTDSLPSQSMSGAYSEGNDVVFSFVRANAATEEAMWGTDDGGLNKTADNLSGTGALASGGSGLNKSIGSVSPASQSLTTSYTGAKVASPSSSGLTTSLSGSYF